MSDKKELTPAEAQAWVDSRVWANGWDVNADATVNAVEFARQYAANKELWDKLFCFLRDNDLHTLPAGKHVIEEGKVWVNILEYTPKDPASTRTETHQDYIDLQYTFEGEELMGLATKGVPTGPYDPVKDRTFYTIEDADVSYVPAAPDRFFLYFPSDMHQPSITAVEPAVPSRKAVGKIIYAK